MALGAAVTTGQYFSAVRHTLYDHNMGSGELTYSSTFLAENTQEAGGAVLQIAVIFPTEQRGLSVGIGVMAGSVALSNVVGMPCSPR